MNKNYYKSAMDKIGTTDELKNKILKEILTDRKAKSKISFNKFIAIAGVFIMIFATANLLDLTKKDNQVGNFRITGEGNSDSKDSYALVLYLDGFLYEYSGWIGYNYNYFKTEDVGTLRGEKIGEVELDLKGLKYEGIPPDFSSTYEKGTEIYEIKGMKKSNALLLDDGNISFILYNSRKAMENLSQPIGLNVKDIMDMVTDFPLIIEVELRSEEDGSWMRTSHDDSLLDLLNSEIPKEKIYNYEEDNSPNYDSSYRVPVNFIFEDGTALHAQVYPETNSAYIFGGYINISEELSNKFKDLNKLSDQYSRFVSLLGYDRYSIGYFQIQDFIKGDSIISKGPSWSGSAFYGTFNYYCLENIGTLEGLLVASIKIGKSQENFKKIDMYGDRENNLFFRIEGETYRIVKGSLRYKDIVDFKENYMED